jgi:hypothetical protein
MDLLTWISEHREIYTAALILLAATVVSLRIAQWFGRRRGRAELHPNLQKYAGKSDAEIEADRSAALKIIATSSTARITGFQLMQQIEAVFVEGYRTPDEAVTALKASAGRRGANAIINLSQSRTAGGRCTAQGDAVLVKDRQH